MLTSVFESTIAHPMEAKTIKKIRKRLAWTQSKLAFQLGVTTRTIQFWEKKGCKKGSPAAQLLETLQ